MSSYNCDNRGQRQLLAIGESWLCMETAEIAVAWRADKEISMQAVNFDQKRFPRQETSVYQMSENQMYTHYI